MGIGRFFLHDFFTAMELNEIERTNKRRDRGIRRVGKQMRERHEELQDQVDRLTLFTVALAELSVAKGAITRDELHKMIHEIDMRDGVADGKIAADLTTPQLITDDDVVK